jgi:hypothetical protein
MTWFTRFARDATAKLAGEIVSTANTCARKIVGKLQPRTEKRENTRAYEVFCEFLFGFLHIGSRLAVGLYGATEKTTRILAPLAPLVASSHVETYFGHLPADQKKRIERTFLVNLGEAQKSYAACRALLVEGKPYSKEAVTGLLVLRVTEIAGDPTDVADLLVAEGVTTNRSRQDESAPTYQRGKPRAMTSNGGRRPEQYGRCATRPSSALKVDNRLPSRLVESNPTD